MSSKTGGRSTATSKLTYSRWAQALPLSVCHFLFFSCSPFLFSSVNSRMVALASYMCTHTHMFVYVHILQDACMYAFTDGWMAGWMDGCRVTVACSLSFSPTFLPTYPPSYLHAYVHDIHACYIYIIYIHTHTHVIHSTYFAYLNLIVYLRAYLLLTYLPTLPALLTIFVLLTLLALHALLDSLQYILYLVYLLYSCYST